MGSKSTWSAAKNLPSIGLTTLTFRVLVPPPPLSHFVMARVAQILLRILVLRGQFQPHLWRRPTSGFGTGAPWS